MPTGSGTKWVSDRFGMRGALRSGLITTGASDSGRVTPDASPVNYNKHNCSLLMFVRAHQFSQESGTMHYAV